MGQMGTTIETITELSGSLAEISSTLAKSGQLEKTVQNFAETSAELKQAVRENREALKSTMDNFAAASRTARSLSTDREAQIRKAMDDFSSAAAKMDHLASRLDSLRAVISNVSAKVDRGEGTLGRLVNDDKLYDDLSTSVKSLRILVEDIKKNPKKYIHLSVF
jgi:phospholipid/cholesterol/gamma-HCH transport system substrate-binding protein